MKVFSFRNILGLAAIGGAYAYAKKHGGFKPAFEHLMRKKDELLAKAKESDLAKSAGVGTEPSTMSTGYSSNTYERH
jgi:hypothetical protein